MATNTHDSLLAAQPIATESLKSKVRKPMRLWPGVVLALLIVALRLIAAVAPEMIGGEEMAAFKLSLAGR